MSFRPARRSTAASRDAALLAIALGLVLTGLTPPTNAASPDRPVASRHWGN